MQDILAGDLFEILILAGAVVLAIASLVIFIRRAPKKGVLQAYLEASLWPLDGKMDPQSFEAKAEGLRKLAADRDAAAKTLVERHGAAAPEIARDVAKQFEGATDIDLALAWRDIAERAAALLGRPPRT